MNIKAVFFDIDGTLVPFDTHKVSVSTRKALKELQQRGTKIFISTGRPKILINNLEDIQFDGYVTLNGAHCYFPDGQQLYQDHISTDDISRLINYARTHPFPIVFVDDKQWFITHYNSDVDTISHTLEVEHPPIAPIEQALQYPVSQMMGYWGPEHDEYIFSEILKGCEVMRWHPLFTDIIAHGNSKRHGIELIMQHFGFKRDEVMAFGDGGNDIQMLDFVGLGVAMGNAEDHVKQYADFITHDVNNDGIRHALQHFGLID